jgi:hypothetical protein
MQQNQDGVYPLSDINTPESSEEDDAESSSECSEEIDLKGTVAAEVPIEKKEATPLPSTPKKRMGLPLPVESPLAPTVVVTSKASPTKPMPFAANVGKAPTNVSFQAPANDTVPRKRAYERALEDTHSILKQSKCFVTLANFDEETMPWPEKVDGFTPIELIAESGLQPYNLECVNKIALPDSVLDEFLYSFKASVSIKKTKQADRFVLLFRTASTIEIGRPDASGKYKTTMPNWAYYFDLYASTRLIANTNILTYQLVPTPMAMGGDFVVLDKVIAAITTNFGDIKFS